MIETAEPTATPEAVGMMAALLCGSRPPYLMPFHGRTVRPALDRKRSNLDDDENDRREPANLEDMPPEMYGQEACSRLRIAHETLNAWAAALGIVPKKAATGRGKLWTPEQVRRLAGYRGSAHG